MIDWQEIDTVLLDMDGTLLDLHFDNHFWLEHLPARFASINNIAIAAARDDLWQRFDQARGSLNWYCLDYWSEQLQLDIASLKQEVQHLIRIRPFVLEFLQQLQAGRQQLLLVTNAHRDSLNLKMQRTQLSSYFNAIISSHDFATPKEDPAFWQQLQQVQAYDPARSLLIDDTASVLSSARQYGIKHLLTLLQPDSQQARREAGEFTGILHFDEILPISMEYAGQQ